MIDTERNDSSRAVARYAGYALFLLFFALVSMFAGFQITYGPLFQSISPGEFVMWFGVATLLFPGSCALGYGLAPSLGPVLESVARIVNRASRRQLAIGLAVLYGVAVCLFSLGNRLVLRGYPITDDEYAVKFGGQVLASGHVRVPMFSPAAVVPQLFLFIKNGTVTAMDWLGGQVAWAIAESTGLGNVVFAVAAAVPLVCIPFVVLRRYGPSWALFALAILVCSPMGLCLSITTHAHVLSRAFLAIALGLYVVAEDSRSARAAFLCGLSLGVSFVCRPFETVFLAAPFGIAAVMSILRGDRDVRRLLIAFAGGTVLPLACFCVHAWLITGNPFRPPRLAPEANLNRFGAGPPFKRLGTNVAYNLFLLTVWFAGPLGILLASLGCLRDRLCRLLSLSFVSFLGLAMFHDNIGIHSVGPMHYSEAILPLSIVSVAGAITLRDRLKMLGLSFHAAASTIALFLVFGLGSFSAIELIALRRQAEIQSQLYGTLETAIPAPQKAVVIADDFRSIWQSIDLLRLTGSWVLEWRRPQPGFDDRILIVLYRPGTEAELRSMFPDRTFYRYQVSTDYANPRLTPLP